MIRRIIRILFVSACLATVLVPRGILAGQESVKGMLYAGWAFVDITPDRPVALEGQMYTRISKFVHDPLTATALALETKQGEARIGEALMISADLCAISKDEILEPLRALLRQRLSDLDTARVIVNVTHTHTGPVTGGLLEYEIPPNTEVMRTPEYQRFLLGKLAEAAVSAWQARRPALVSWGLGYAVVGHNRRAVYADGTAQMYGKTDRSDFRRFEGYEDHAVQALFFWTPERQLTGVAALVPCPSQLVEEEQYLSADFWSEARQELWKRHGKNLFVYPMTGASGDQSPHLMFRNRAEELRRRGLSLSATQDVGRRIANAVDDALDGARTDLHAELPLMHQVAVLRLPRRMVTAAEAEAARKEYEEALKAKEGSERQWHLYFGKQVMDRFSEQERNREYLTEVHTIRLGDVAIVTNPFELFLDYGLQMGARSPAVETLVVQLSCGYGGYLPTALAIQGGSYSTKPSSNEVGPEGGDLLVNRTVEMIQALWGDSGNKPMATDTPATHD
jgi:hypothetical protein